MAGVGLLPIQFAPYTPSFCHQYKRIFRDDCSAFPCFAGGNRSQRVGVSGADNGNIRLKYPFQIPPLAPTGTTVAASTIVSVTTAALNAEIQLYMRSLCSRQFDRQLFNRHIIKPCFLIRAVNLNGHHFYSRKGIHILPSLLKPFMRTAFRLISSRLCLYKNAHLKQAHRCEYFIIYYFLKQANLELRSRNPSFPLGMATKTSFLKALNTNYHKRLINIEIHRQ